MWMPNPKDLDVVKQYEDLGVSRLIVPVQALGQGNPAENIQNFGENVIPQLG